MAQKEPKEMSKTSMRLPTKLWKEVRRLAIDEDRDAQDIVADALRAYLHPPKKEKGKKS